MARGSPLFHAADLRGAARLATEATAGITDLVEAMHERIARLPGLPAPPDTGRTRGITGFVYRAVRGITRATGSGVDGLLGLLAPPAPGDETSPRREALLAALNGVLGDHLDATGNPLATPMTLRHGGLALPLADAAALAARLPGAGGTVAVFVHGLCMNDLQWRRRGHEHGAALAAAHGFTPVHARYNSGLHVSVNGRLLAQQLEQLVAHWPRPVQRLVLVGHSMGGLLARSALHQAALAGQGWVRQVSDLVCLGTPHHGAPLERAGHGLDTLLTATPYAAPFARLGQVRSAGITDLRHGNLLDADWAGHDRFQRRGDPRVPVPLPAGVRCHAIASTWGPDSTSLQGRLLGDGLVPLASALGRHRDPARRLAFEPGRQWVGQGIHHLDLLCDAEVSRRLVTWLAPAA